MGNAQSKTESVWQSIILQHPISKKTSWQNEVGYRTLGYSIVPKQFLYRTGIKYQVNRGMSLSAGAAIFFTRVKMVKEINEFGLEKRIWQEVKYQNKIVKQTNLQIRVRVEERFFQATTAFEPYAAVRFRYKGSLERIVFSNLVMQLGYEYMQQLKGSKISFNQSRFQPALMMKLNQSMQLQGMFMVLKTPSEKQHTIWLTYQLQL